MTLGFCTLNLKPILICKYDSRKLISFIQKNFECVCVEAQCCTKVSDLYNTFEEKMRSLMIHAEYEGGNIAEKIHNTCFCRAMN